MLVVTLAKTISLTHLCFKKALVVLIIYFNLLLELATNWEW
jgi:hypothetical protein